MTVGVHVNSRRDRCLFGKSHQDLGRAGVGGVLISTTKSIAMASDGRARKLLAGTLRVRGLVQRTPQLTWA